MKKWFVFLISALLCIGLLGVFPQAALAADDVTDSISPVQTINMNNHDHFAFGEIIKSYLFENDDHTLTRVEYTPDGVAAEIYSRDFQFICGKSLPVELPIFGGFYAGEDYNFLIFGQENPEESDTAEVVRIVRYSKDWVRLDCASLYGMDTEIPFRSSSLRCTEYNGYLYIRTARRRYDYHQSNTMMTLRISDMTAYFNRDVGFVSHSFNQFITNEGSTLITVDLGDAYPRAVVLRRYNKPLGDDLYYNSYYESVNVLPIMGEIGDNSTGVSMGGVEVSGSCYIVAGNSVVQDENYYDLGPRNIFVTATRKDQFSDEGTTFRFLTSYTDEDNIDISPPHLVKISDDSLLILWSENRYSPKINRMRYAFLDGEGNLTGPIYSANNPLSDCKPITVDGKVIWYVTSVSDPVFFVIDPKDPENLPHQHLFQYSVVDYATYSYHGELSCECKLCGQVGETVRVPSIREKPDEYNLTGTLKPPTCLEGGYVEPFWSKMPFYGITFCSSSNVWHPALGHDYETVTTAATCTQAGSVTTTCLRCGDSSSETIPELGHSYQSVTVEPDCYNDGLSTHTCTTCGHSYSEVFPSTGHVCDEYRVHKEPSNMMVGRLEGYCTACDQSIYVSIPPLRMGNYRYEVRQEPTCDEEGYAVYIWETPEYGYFEFTTLFAPTGHAYETQTTPATCTAGGFVTHRCTTCGHSYITDQTVPLDHSFENGACTVCGAADPTNAYYLVGWINNANHGCEEDYQNPGDYRFVDGKLSVTFHTDSYVFLKTGNNQRWLLTDHYCCEDSTCTFTSEGTEKMRIPGGLQVNFTLVENKDGSVTLSYTIDTVSPTISLEYPTLSFEDVIVMNVYYSASNLEDVVEMGLITYSSKVTTPSVETAEAVVPDYTYNDSDGFYFSSTAGIAPKDIGDTIYFAVYAKLIDGTYTYTGLAGYSPKTYAMNVLKTGKDEMKPLVAAMLNYGAAAQMYFNYKTDSLMNADMTDAQKALVAAYDPSMIATVTQASGDKVGEFVNDNSYTRRYPTISFDGAFCINYYFLPSEAVSGDVTMYIWSLEDFYAATTLTRDNATKAVTMTLTESGEYLGVVDGIAAKDLDKAAYVSFCYNDGTTDHCGGVIAYTIGLYCKAQAAKTGTMADLAAACAVYGYYAKELFYEKA